MSKGNKKRRKTKGLLPASVRCKARNRWGEPCKNYAMKGGVVCNKHGGMAPQVKKKAQERILMAQDDAASLLIRFAHDEAVPYPVRLAAVKDLLDRGGINSKQEIEVVLKPWEEDLDGLLYEMGDDPDVVDAEVVEDEPRAIPPSDVLGYEDSEPSSVRGNRYAGR